MNGIIKIDNTTYENVYPPPNGIEISNNFYMDESEISNIDYREYMYWLESIYGADSKKLNEAKPDTSVWNTKKETAHLSEHYFTHPAYDYYPLVGINLEQAKKYSDWRSEIVAELNLISRGIIKENRDKTAENYFTIERYVEGDYDWIIKKEDIIVPVFTIPTRKEWEVVASCNRTNYLCIDSSKVRSRKLLKKDIPLYNTLELYKQNHTIPENLNHDKTPTVMVRSFDTDEKGIYNLIGNVSEMIDEEGVSKGGHWNKSMAAIKENSDDEFLEANSWTGFRNVCRYKLVKVK